MLRNFFWVCLRCPLEVLVDCGRCLVMREGKSPGKVAKKTSLTACFHVLGLGLQHARCRYFARSFFVHMVYTLDDWSPGCCWCCGALADGFIGVSQSPEGWFCLVVRTIVLVLMLVTVASFLQNHALYLASQNWPTE